MSANDAHQARQATYTLLQKWSRSPSPKLTAPLVNALADLYTAESRGKDAAAGETLAKLICTLVPKMSDADRVALAVRLAVFPAFSHDVIVRLAHDDLADVAVPVIERSEVLNDMDLYDIAGMLLPERTIAIARRHSLTADVTDALARLGDVDTMRTMTGNHGARFSSATFRLIAERAKTDPLLQTELAGRADVPHAIACVIAPFMPEALRSKVLPVDENLPSSLLESLTQITAKADYGRPTNADKRAAYELRGEIETSIITLDKAVGQIAASKKPGAVVALLAGLARLSERRIAAFLAHRDGARLATVCRGLGVSEQSYAGIIALRADHLGLDANHIKAETNYFSRLDLARAEQTLAGLQTADAAPKGTNRGPRRVAGA